MKSKRAYSSTRVNRVDAGKIFHGREGQKLVVGRDIASTFIDMRSLAALSKEVRHPRSQLLLPLKNSDD